jgi:hypothetical protein
MDDNLTIDIVQQVLRNSKIPDILKTHLMSLNFPVLNNYARKYFQSADKKFRITIDSDLKFIELAPIKNTFLKGLNDYFNNILELKYEKEMDDHAERITNLFPFRMTKSSKYIAGVEVLNY